MIASDVRSGVERLGDMIASARTIVPFTGAGISTECGIPDFRSPGGLWTRNRPIPFDEFVASPEVREEAWRRRFAMEPTFAAAKPGRGHRALASLYRAGKIPSIVTQNIDNLHQISGFAAEHVVELHGNTTYARCIGCGQAYDLAWVKLRFDEIGGAPDCTVCDEPVKPPPSRSDRRCRNRRCAAPWNSRSIATCSCRSGHRWWSGQLPDFRRWPRTAAPDW